MIRSTVLLAFSALLRNRMRSILTMLGIVIGIAAVVTMQSMGQGATAYIGEAISGMGSNMLVAVPGGSSRMSGPMLAGVPLFTLADVDAIRRDARDIHRLTPLNSRMLRVVSGANNRTVNVGGVMHDYFDIREWAVAEGRGFSAQDEREASLSCVIGKTVADVLYGGRNPIGQDLRVRDLVCQVIGVLESKGASAFGMDQDDVVYLPYATFGRRIAGSDRVGSIMASAVSADRIDAAKEEVTALLRHRRHIRPGDEDDFSVRDPREVQALLEKVTGVLTTLLAGVAAISLLVGGIGIMNIMLVSVTERTREIGIRLAVGARAGDVLAQFLTEAVVLSMVGGVAGIAVGLLAAMGAARGLGIPYVLSGWAAPLALGVSVLVGVGFGVFPARKAAKLNPLAALRFE